MSPHAYSEDQLIERSCMQFFEQELGWQVYNAYQEPKGPDSELGRTGEKEVLLRKHFLAALRQLNPGLPDKAYEGAWESISLGSAAKNLGEINQEKYKQLRDGIPVTFKNAKGQMVRDKKLKVFDFEQPENNHFLAVQQLWIKGRSYRRRPDIIGFVNGIPLLFMELKAHHRKLRSAYDENLSDYKDTIPHLLHCNAFIILSNGLESKIGSITSKFEHFNDWKRLEEEDEGVVSLDIILRGVCRKGNFMDLFENFILFDSSLGSVAKLVARNHQYLGVNKTFEHFRDLETQYKEGKISLAEKQKLGVFWHTQGSGKSYSMVFFCQKVLRKMGGYTFLLVTDRTELDGQIYSTFAGVGAVKDKELKAGSGKDLQELLQTDSRYIFTLIHKFNFQKVITERENIVVVSDEAHRTQGGTLALNMRNAIPKASFIGFTGTPLFKDDEITRRLFGDYVSTYNFKRSVDDGATVPLYYENRGEKLALDNPKINAEIRAAIESENLDSQQEYKLKRLFARDYPILTAEKRLRAIAKDLVGHFNGRGYKGKAMLVCLDKLTAVRMYNYIVEAWAANVREEQRRVDTLPDAQEVLEAKRDLEWTMETEIAVVVSEEQNEVRRFREWGLDIEVHRQKMKSRDLETDFKDEKHPFRLAIVCAMWITGFDVKSLSTLYLDKPMRSHTLMQTIARANRVHEGKNNGLIVDYIETYKNLLEALAIYAVEGEGGGSGGELLDIPVKPLEELVEELEAAISAVEEFLLAELKFDLASIIEAELLEKIAAIGRGVEAVYTSDASKAKFTVMARAVFQKFKALLPDNAVHAFRERRDAIDAIYRKVQESIDEADVSGLVKKIQDVVDRSVESMSIALEPTSDYGVRVDLSRLDFDLVREHFAKTENKRTVFQTLRQQVSNQLERMVAQNPLRVDFYETYREIIAAYNQGKERVTIEDAFQRLIRFIQDLNEEASRAQREGIPEEYLPIFDLLVKGKPLSSKERSAVKKVAKELLDLLLESQLQVDHWAFKSQTAAAVRTAVHDHLFANLPYPAFDEDDIDKKSEVIFEFLRSAYGDVA